MIIYPRFESLMRRLFSYQVYVQTALQAWEFTPNISIGVKLYVFMYEIVIKNQRILESAEFPAFATKYWSTNDPRKVKVYHLTMFT